MVYEVAIIGGGFSGLCAGVVIGAVFKEKTLILEGNKRIGKKILATGNGQGNLTNLNITPENYHGDRNFAKQCLKRYTNTQMLDFFANLGLVTDSDNGKVYPASYTAGSILDVLRFELERQNVTILTEKYVTSLKKDKVYSILCSNGEIYHAKKVILAFGGKSGAGFLTDGRSYALATQFGHKITSLTPSLVQMKCEKEKIKGLKGIKQEVKVALYSNEKQITAFNGDLLFTDYGISGNSIFSLSAYLKGCANPTVKIEFLPNLQADILQEKLINKCKNQITWERLLISVLPTRLILTILKECKLAPESLASKDKIPTLVNTIKSFTLKIEGTAGFDNSQVTAGGIDTSQINVSTMQSKLSDGLYIIGEALNVDGDCGGYNLQWAFTSAMICSEAIIDAKS